MQCATYRIGLVLLSAGGIASVASSAPRPPAILSDLGACRKQTDPAARLACYDRTVAQLVDATEKRDVVVLDRAGIRETRKSLFGFALPRIGLFEGRNDNTDPATQEEITELQTRIVSVRDLGNGRYQLVLAEGGTWQSTEHWVGAHLPTVGANILIRRAALGSYFLKLDGGRAVRGMRVG